MSSRICSRTILILEAKTGVWLANSYAAPFAKFSSPKVRPRTGFVTRLLERFCRVRPRRCGRLCLVRVLNVTMANQSPIPATTEPLSDAHRSVAVRVRLHIVVPFTDRQRVIRLREFHTLRGQNLVPKSLRCQCSKRATVSGLAIAHRKRAAARFVMAGAVCTIMAAAMKRCRSLLMC